MVLSNPIHFAGTATGHGRKTPRTCVQCGAVKRMSVVLVVGSLRERAVGALGSILAQECVDELEIVLIDLDRERSAPLPGSGHRCVRTISMPETTVYSAARLHGVREAATPIVAFVEEHCRVDAGWAAALMRAHEGPYAAVGGEIHNGNPHVRLSRTIALMNYNLWMPPARRGEFDLLPGHNSTFKREALLAYGDELEMLLRAEVALFHRMHRDGHRLLLEPDAKFEHINETRLSSIAGGYFLWHRCYGPVRARAFGWSRGRRLFYVAATPLIPFYYLLRLTLVLLRTRPRLVLQAWLAAPQILWAQYASALGQATGLLFGTSDAESRFTRYELNEPRIG
jgi:hypothetical protein